MPLFKGCEDFPEPGNIEERIHISRNNKCLLVINAELHAGEWPPKLGRGKRLPSRSESLAKALKKGLDRL